MTCVSVTDISTFSLTCLAYTNEYVQSEPDLRLLINARSSKTSSSRCILTLRAAACWAATGNRDKSDDLFCCFIFDDLQ